MSIEIVTHCWAESNPLYAVMLRAQLSSIYLHNPSVPYRVIVCTSKTDHETMKVIRLFESQIHLHCIKLPNPYLWRRSIGRNKAARECKTELIWFTDCDYLFNAKCLDSIVNTWHEKEKPDLMWPTRVKANHDKTEVDQFIIDNLGTIGIIQPKINSWYSMYVPRAIGGVQIASGSWCRERGYVGHKRRLQSPVDIPFPDFRDDVWFRDILLKAGKCKSVRIPGLCRLRHTEVGYQIETQ